MRTFRATATRHLDGCKATRGPALLPYGMTFRRTPKDDPPAVLLMRTIGDLQSMEGGEPITDIESVALMSGIVWVDLPALIEVGITAGFLEDDGSCAVVLSAKGQRWYKRDPLRRD